MRIYLLILILMNTAYSSIDSYKILSSLNQTTISLFFDKKVSDELINNLTKSVSNEDVLIKVNDDISFKKLKSPIKKGLIPFIQFSYKDKITLITLPKSKSLKMEIISNNNKIQIILTKVINPDVFKPKLKASIGITPYLISITIIAVMLVLYFIVKKKINTNLENNNIKNYKLLLAKQIDLKTKLIVFNLNDKRYTILSGNNFSTLIDKLDIDIKEDFATILKNSDDERLS